MKTFKRAALLLLAVFLAPLLRADYYNTGRKVPHGHTSNVDGGLLGSLVLTGTLTGKRGLFTRTAVYTSGIDSVVFSSWTTSPGASGLVVGSYNFIASTYSGTGVGHTIGAMGDAYTSSGTNDQLLIGVEGRAVQASTFTNARAYGLVGRGVLVSTTTSGTSIVAGVYGSGECYSDVIDGTPNAGCIPISIFSAPTVGGAFGYSFFAAGDTMYQGGPATFGGAVTHSAMSLVSAKFFSGSPINVSITSSTIISWNTEYLDRLSEFNGSTFTAASAGNYEICATVTHSSSAGAAGAAGDDLWLFFSKNGAGSGAGEWEANAQVPTSTLSVETVGGCYVIALSANDNITIRAASSAANAPRICRGLGCFMSIKRLP